MLVILSATRRPTKSVGPPGGNATTMRIGRLGKSCALANCGVSASKSAAMPHKITQILCTVSPRNQAPAASYRRPAPRYRPSASGHQVPMPGCCRRGHLTCAGPSTNNVAHGRRHADRRPADRPAAAYAPAALVPGADPGAAALLGGLGLRHLAALRHGGRRRHLSSGDDAARARPEAVECRLCAALAPAQGRPLRREPQPAAALLSVPGDPQTVAGRSAGALSEIALRHRHRSEAARHPLRRGRLGKPDARRLGARLGMLVRRHGGVAVHLFPAGRGLRMCAGRGRTHLRPRAAGDVCAGRRERLSS